MAGILIGTARVQITPDMSGFITEVQAEIKSGLAAVRAEVPVKFDVDAASVAKAQAALGPLAAGKTVPLRFDVDPASVARARAALGPLAGKTIPVRYDVNPAGLVAADAATKALTADTNRSAAAATLATRRFGGLFRLAGARVPLFGGVFGTAGILGAVGAVHLLVDAVAEVLAIAVPASVALAAFGIGAAPTVRDIVQQMQNLHTVATALNRQMPGLGNSLTKLEDSVKPEVFSLFGDALTIVNQKSGEFTTLATQTGSAVDRLGARFTLAITNGQGLSKILAVGATDVAKLGDVVGNLGGALGNVFRVLPGYANDLLNLADAGSKVLEWATRVGEPVIGFGLAAHGAVLYTGLLATGLISLGRRAATAGTPLNRLGQFIGVLPGPATRAYGSVTRLENGVFQAGVSAAEAGTRTNIFKNSLNLLQKVPVWGWVATGVAVLGGLAFVIGTAKDRTQAWVGSLQANIAGQKTFIGVVNATADAAIKVNAQLAKTPEQVIRAGQAYGRFPLASIAQRYGELRDAQRQVNTETAQEQRRIAQLEHIFGTTGNALGLFNKLGISAGDIATANAGKWREDIQMLQDYLNAVTELAGYQGGRALAAQRAMTRAQSEQAAAVQQVTQAEDNTINTIIGGEQAFNAFATYLKQTARDAGPANSASQQLAAAQARVASAQRSVNQAQNAGGPSAISLASAQDRVRAAQDHLNAVQKTGHVTAIAMASAQDRVRAAQDHLNAVQKTGTSSSGQLAAAQNRLAAAQKNLAATGKGTQATLGGLNTASLALANDFYNHLIPAAQKQIDTLNAQFISTQKLTPAVATMAKHMLVFAGNNVAGRVAVLNLINNALGPATVSLRTLNHWVGQNSTSMRGYRAIVDQSEVSASELAKSLQNDLNVQFHQALLSSSGADSALKTYTSDLVHNRAETTKGRADRAQLIADLKAAGLDAKQAAAFVANLVRQMGGLHSKKITITEFGSGSFNISEGGHVVAHGVGSNVASVGHRIGITGASGAFVAEGTTPTADDVFARVSKGELIVPAKMVTAGLVDHLRGQIPGFQAGGVVGTDLPVFTRKFDQAMTDVMTTAMIKAMKAATARAEAAAAQTFAGGLGRAGLRGLENLWTGAGGPGGGTAHVAAAIALAESGGNPNARNPSGACVPLATQILTRRGWLSHDQVRIGDETIGYNPETGRNEWTPVVVVHHYEDAEVWRIGNVHWKADVTPNHRWWSDSRVRHGAEGCRKTRCDHPGRFRGEFVSTDALRSHHRLRLAAEADTDGIPGLSTEDCAVIGWLMGDGHVDKARGQRVTESAVRETRAGKRIWISGGKRAWTDEDRGWDAAIYQAKPAQVVRLRALLAHVPHTERVRQRSMHRPHCEVSCHQRHTDLPSHEFVLRREYATDLLKRARWGEITPEEFVLALSPDQRAAWLAALIDAEGSRVPGYKASHAGHVRIAQNEGPLLEAIKLAVYLEGFQPSVVCVTPSGRCRTVGLRSPHAALPGWGALEVLERQPVWCVTTGLGTWTMRQSGHIPCLTGNSGLWQILGQVVPGNIFNPVVNAENAVKKYRDAGGFSPWVTFESGAYLRFMDQGGTLPPGLSLMANMTGGNEFVLRADQLARIAHGGGGNTYIAQFPDEWAAGAMESRIRQGFTAMEINAGRRARIGRNS